jgi:hypothetical protein
MIMPRLLISSGRTMLEVVNSVPHPTNAIDVGKPLAHAVRELASLAA